MKGSDLTKVALIATTDEETGSATTRELIENVSKKATAVLVLECGCIICNTCHCNIFKTNF